MKLPSNVDICFFLGIGVASVNKHMKTQICDSNAGLCRCHKVLSCLFYNFRVVE